MPIRYHCPHCGQHLSIASRLAGHQTKCPACLTAHVVPETDEHGSAAPKRRSRPEAGPVLHTETKPQERTAEKQTPARHVTVKAAPRQPVERQTPERPTEKREAAERATPERKHLVPAVAEHPQGPSIPISYEIDPLEDDDDEEALVIGKIERKSDELDLIPMVDCVFLLLIFYMITASYALQKTIEMGKPAAEKKGAMSSVQTIDETAQSSVVVQIDARNRISVDDVPLDSVAGLPDRLRAKMNGEQKNELVIEADPKALHETIVAVVDAAHELQFQHVRMALNTGDND
jgi:biopolymer transport protein ExbD